ncbi:MAG: DUF488 family protein, N3 subclade, partial [Nitrososphaera sp.]
VRKEHFDYWLQELSPSKKLLFDYKESRITWSEFKEHFLLEITENNDSLDAIYALNHHGKFGDVTVLCYERAGNPCHRHLIRDIIDDPNLISCSFEPKHTYDHEGGAIETLVSNKEADVPLGIVKP